MTGSRTMLVLFSLVVLSPSTASALDLKDVKKVPSWYATETEVTDPQGKKQKQVAYGRGAYAVSGEAWNQILSAYGVTLVDVKKVPSWYATETEVTDPQGKKQKQVAYGRGAYAVSGEAWNQILGAYK